MTAEQPSEQSNDATSASVDVPNVQLVVGTRGLFVHLFAVRGGQTLVEIGMMPEEAIQVAAALQLHAAKAQSLTPQKPNA